MGEDTYEYHAIKCPHCGDETYPEGEDYREGDKDWDCSACGGKFTLRVEHHVTFEGLIND